MFLPRVYDTSSSYLEKVQYIVETNERLLLSSWLICCMLRRNPGIFSLILEAISEFASADVTSAKDRYYCTHVVP